ncbi:MAG: Holliday junction ATP-dependent DNA helicase RuvB [Turneriella sp.]|nr:Holliday junction ATP-dependent DNA helicase RuvB [Turneriella sp.]
MIEPHLQLEKNEQENQVRPVSLADFIGQKDLVENLRSFLKAASIRKEPLDHILLSGPPGLGKTTLARIVAQETGARFSQVTAPNIKRPGDLAKILSGLSTHDVLFIDEIHRLPVAAEELLYGAMEDRTIDIAVGDAVLANSVQITLPPFTLVGATTRPGDLTAPLRDRFGIKFHLEFYEEDDLIKIIERASKLWKIPAEKNATRAIARRARSTPRIALHLLRRVWDYALAESESLTKAVTEEAAKAAFERMHIDAEGMTKLDRQLLLTIANHYQGGPVGLKPLSSILAEDLATLEDFVEPYLVRRAFIRRTPRGRVLTKDAFQHLGLKPTGDVSLFDILR